MGNTNALPFEMCDEIKSSHQYWSIYEGVAKQDESTVTVMTTNIKKNNMTVECARRGMTKLRSLKHPNILSFVDGTELEDSIIMATEAAIPLSKFVESITINSENDINLIMEEIIYGMRCILEGLQFLHRTAKLLHGCISMDSIFITSQGDWKLGLLDIASDVSIDEKYFNDYQYLQPDEFKAPERNDGSWRGIYTSTLFNT